MSGLEQPRISFKSSKISFFCAMLEVTFPQPKSLTYQ